MAELQVANVGNALMELLMAPDLSPGDQPSYQTCKTILAYHPLGAKIVDSPLTLAQSQKRQIAIPKGPEERLVEAFDAAWQELHADAHIFNFGRLSRAYGIASIAILVEGEDQKGPLDLSTLHKKSISFNVYDPLNTAGSLVLNQDPMSLDFLKPTSIAVGGVPFHRSRTVVLMPESPLYIEYTTSAFGFVGRSVYQRALYPLKSFINTMITDDLIAYKAGVIVTKIKQPGSIIDRAMSYIAGIKRAFIKVATVGNVISIAPDEMIETLNFQNLHNPFGMARKDILDNIATAADMPAILLNQETFAEGFGEGTEDAKRVAQYIAQIRSWLKPAYDFFDRIVQYWAWNEDFYKGLQKDFPERYKNVPFKTAFAEWTGNFSARWPNLIEEPDSELIKVDDVRLKAVIAALETLLPAIDPENRAKAIQWAADCFNANKMLFPSPLILDYDDLKDYVPPVEAGLDGISKEPAPAPPFSSRDSASLRNLSDAVAALTPPKPPARRRLPSYAED